MRFILALFVISTFIRMINAEDWFSVGLLSFLGAVIAMLYVYERFKKKPEPFYDSNYEDFSAEYRYGISHSHKEE